MNIGWILQLRARSGKNGARNRSKQSVSPYFDTIFQEET